MICYEGCPVIFKYESGFWQSSQTIEQIAAAIDPYISADIRRDVADRYCNQSLIEKMVAAVPCVDNRTHWHVNHIGDGQVGKWAFRLPTGQRQAADMAFCNFVGRWYGLAATRWPASVFLYNSKTSRPIMRGGVATLYLELYHEATIYGPYLFIPAGRWQAMFHLYAQTNVDVTIDVVVSGTCVATDSITLGSSLLVPVLVFDHRDPTLPVECRLFFRDSLPNKEILFGGVSLRQCQNADSFSDGLRLPESSS
jgi:hypothetical protein